MRKKAQGKKKDAQRNGERKEREKGRKTIRPGCSSQGLNKNEPMPARDSTFTTFSLFFLFHSSVRSFLSIYRSFYFST